MANWKYFIDGVEQTFLRRVLPTKTFQAAALVVCGATMAALKGEITWKAAASTAAAGAAVVFVRAAITKLELSQNANNDALPNVEARPVGNEPNGKENQ